MNKSLALALLVGGIIAFVVGAVAFDSTSSDISRFFTGAATDKSIWLLICGGAAAVTGLFGLTRVSRTG